MKLSNNTILITGGGSGIGLAFAEKFLELGNDVLICGRDQQKLDAAQARHPGLKTFRCDLTHPDDTAVMVEKIKSDFPALNMLINNAGIQYNYRFDDGADHATKIDHEINANFSSHLRLTDALLPLLTAKKVAAVVNISSALSIVPKESAPVYCATKAGVHIFSRALRYQLERSPVKVFEVVPALVDTAMTAGRGKGKMSPAALVAEAIKGIEHDKFYIRIGKTKLLFAIHRLFPFLAGKIIRKG